ncbi:polyprenol phosphomannose-dependent alpha 1,6 mannosyltransferase MptB [Actinoplanes sp. NPDC051859]|uniref:polyprenol phosphomannose-dependent alpha 1,6 mannosyltransferase MptB n=1 Tax=Actinoplanes sp. NPDC051859 TaxID=3363909 RepID=UPI003792B3B2
MAVTLVQALLPGTLTVALGLTGMGLVVAAWSFLGRTHRQLPTRTLYGIAAAWSAPLLAAAPLFSGDVWSYLAQGLITASGQDPYTLGPLPALGSASPVTQHVSHYWLETPAPYGPAWLALSRGVALVTGEHLIAAVGAYRMIALVGVALLAWALPRLARRAGADPSSAVWLGLLNPLVLWHLVAGVHNDALLLGVVLCGLELALSGMDRAFGQARIAAGLALVTVAANIKVVGFAAVCCLAVVLARRGNPFRTVLGVAAGSAAVTAGISWWTGLGFGWIGAMGASTAVHSWLAPTNMLGFLVGGIGKLAGVQITEPAIRVLVLVGAAGCAVIVVRLLLAMYRGTLEVVRGLGLVLAAVVLCGPVVQPWYLLWAVLPLAAAARRRRDRTILAGVGAVLALALPPVAAGVLPLITGYLAAGGLFALLALLLRPAAAARVAAGGRCRASVPSARRRPRRQRPGRSAVRPAHP